MNNFLLICNLILAITNIDTSKSLIFWKGTKLANTGYHEGTLKFHTGSLYFNKGKITGGSFDIEMNSLRVTDIPTHETVPLTALTRHLKEEFEVRQYPLARLVITHVNGGKATAKLTIMNTSNTINFPIKKTERGYEAKFAISRKVWHIGHKASWLENKLVDDLIQISVHLYLK